MLAYRIAAWRVENSAPGIRRRENATAHVEVPAGATTNMFLLLRYKGILGCVVVCMVVSFINRE